MHGFIFAGLRKYVDTKLGGDAWHQLLHGAGLGSKLYLPIQEYPDSDAVALVAAASEMTGLPQDAILEDFGEFLAPELLGLYRTLVQPEWKTLDLLEHTEHTIHSVVRARNAGARPAHLNAVRLAPDKVDLTYRSARRLCPVAKGILRGMGKHYGETILVEETECMHDGAEACRMEVTVVAAGVVQAEAQGGAKPKATEAGAKAPKATAGAAKPVVAAVKSRKGRKTSSAAKAKSSPKASGPQSKAAPKPTAAKAKSSPKASGPQSKAAPKPRAAKAKAAPSKRRAPRAKSTV